MRSGRWIRFLAVGVFFLCGLAIGRSSEAGVKVWAVGDTVRIDPESGKAFEEDEKVLPGGLKAGYRDKNWVWDGRSVRLKAARNEVVAFQVIIEAPQGASNVELRASDLIGRDSVIERRYVKFFREWYFKLERLKSKYALRDGWYPDALIPLESPKHGAPFDIPSEDFYYDYEVEKQTPRQINQAVWVDVYVPEGTGPGAYSGEIVVTGRARREFEIRLPVRLDVREITLPSKNHTAFEFMCYGGDVVRFEDGLAYYQLVHQHRVTIGAKSLVPPVVNRGAPDATFDWTEFDRKWSGLFDGTAFTEGPGKGVPVRHIMLRFDHAWPGYAMFSPADITDAAGLAARLKGRENALTRYLWDQLSRGTQRLLRAFDGSGPPSEEMKKALSDDLNRVLLAGSLYEEKRFAGVNVPERLVSSIQGDEKGYSAPRNNRLVLEAVFRGMISRRSARYVMGREEADRMYQRLIKAWRDHFVSRGWTETELIVWSDTLDEPKFHKGTLDSAMDQLRNLKKFAELVHKSGAEGVKYRMDIGGGFARCRYDLDGDGKRERSKDVVDALGDSIDLWNVHGNCIDAELLAPLIKAGKAQAWFYNGYKPRVGTKLVNEEGVGLRTWPWIVWLSGISGCCDWHFLHKVRNREIFHRSNDKQTPGDAQYVYPGQQIGLSGPIGSIRLKIIRRGLQDYEYLWLLSQKKDGRTKGKRIALGVVWQTLGTPAGPIYLGVPEEVLYVDLKDKMEKVEEVRKWKQNRRLWKPTWVHDPQAWSEARDRLAEAILKD